MKKLVLVTAILAVGTFAAQAETAMTTLNGDIGIAGNWTNGLPLIGNQGTISIDANRASNVHIDGWDLIVDGGTLTDDVGGYNARELRGGSIFDIQTGGTYIRTNATYGNAIRIHGGATLKVSGGTAIMSGFAAVGTQAGGFTLDVSDGSCWLAKVINFNNGVNTSTINVSGGTLEFGDADVRNIDEPNTFFNISGGTLTYSKLDYATTANDTNIVVTISNDGALVTYLYDNVDASAAADRYINFATDNLSASWTWTGKVSTDFISMWNAGTLRHNGESGLTAATFADHFAVVDDTVSPAAPPQVTELTASGAWATPANWSDGVPTTAHTAKINGGLTANLSAATGTAKVLSVGNAVSETGTVENGSLTIVNATSVGIASNATGVVDVTAYTAGTANDDVFIGAGTLASGSLVAGSGTITGNGLSVGVGDGATGELDIGSGSLSFDVATMIGNGVGANGSVDAATFTLSGNSDLTLGSSSNASGRITASNGSVDTAVLTIASGQDSDGTLDLGSGTAAVSDSVFIATGKDSIATVSLGGPIVLNSTNGLFVGTGVGSSNNMTASDFSISGPIGDFGVGESTDASIKNLFNLNDTIGFVTANAALNLSGGHHEMTRISLAEATDSIGSLTLTGTASVDISGDIAIASGDQSSASLDLASLVSGVHTAAVINVARGDGAVGSLTYTADNLHRTGTMEVGSGGNGSDGTVLLKSTTGNAILSVANAGTAATGTVTVLESAEASYVRVARGDAAVGTLVVGDTLTVAGLYLNAAGLGSNAVGRISATTLNKTSSGGAIQVAQGVNSDGSITAEAGTLSGSGLAVSSGNGSLGLFAVTNGTVTTPLLSIAEGNDSDGTVLVGIVSSAADDIKIGTGTNAIGRLTLPNGTLEATNLLLGDAGAGGVGIINLTGGSLTVSGTVGGGTGTSSYVDVQDGASTFTWTGKLEADFETLWNTGMLRSNGESGLTAATFSDYFTVAGDVLTPNSVTPPGIIAIANGPGAGEMTISWSGVSGQSYAVQYKNSLILPTWLTYTTVAGVDGPMSVPVPSTEDETFYQVIAQ